MGTYIWDGPVWLNIVFSIVGLYSGCLLNAISHKRLPTIHEGFSLVGMIPFTVTAALIFSIHPFVSLLGGFGAYYITYEKIKTTVTKKIIIHTQKTPATMNDWIKGRTVTQITNDVWGTPVKPGEVESAPPKPQRILLGMDNNGRLLYTEPTHPKTTFAEKAAFDAIAKPPYPATYEGQGDWPPVK